jgi:hypothetical protein
MIFPRAPPDDGLGPEEDPMNSKKTKEKERRRARELAEQVWKAVNERNIDLAEKTVRPARIRKTPARSSVSECCPAIPTRKFDERSDSPSLVAKPSDLPHSFKGSRSGFVGVLQTSYGFGTIEAMSQLLPTGALAIPHINEPGGPLTIDPSGQLVCTVQGFS